MDRDYHELGKHCAFPEAVSSHVSLNCDAIFVYRTIQLQLAEIGAPRCEFLEKFVSLYEMAQDAGVVDGVGGLRLFDGVNLGEGQQDARQCWDALIAKIAHSLASLHEWAAAKCGDAEVCAELLLFLTANCSDYQRVAGGNRRV